jgi:hypothetical protein
MPEVKMMDPARLTEIIREIARGAAVIGGHDNPEGIHLVLDTIAGKMTLMISHVTMGSLFEIFEEG